MPRNRRITPAGYFQHVLNRGNERARVFHKPSDYEAFLATLAEGLTKVSLEIIAFCLMPNHFHLVVLPPTEYAIPAYMKWTMGVHVRRYRKHYDSVGHGHIYQDRYKNFLIEDAVHLLTVIRYVEANAVRAMLVDRAEDWPWSSLGCSATQHGQSLLSDWPIPRPSNWPEIVNAPFLAEELRKIRRCAGRAAPYGTDDWVKQTVKRFGLESTLRPANRPAKPKRGTVPLSDEESGTVPLFE